MIIVAQTLVLSCMAAMQIKSKKLFQKFFQKSVDKHEIIMYNNEVACETKLSLVGLCGSIAQLGEHLPYKQRVIGSSPIVPTKLAR